MRIRRRWRLGRPALMGCPGWVVFFLLALSPMVAMAQESTSNTADIQDTNRLDTILRNWEQATSSRREVRAQFTLARSAKLRKPRPPEKGELWALRGQATRVDLRDENQQLSIYFWSNNQLRFFDGKSRTENIYATAPGGENKRVPDFREHLVARMVDLPQRIQFTLFGITEREANARFAIRVLEDNDKEIRLEFDPLLLADKRDVKLLEATFHSSTFAPVKVRVVPVLGGQVLLQVEEFTAAPTIPVTLETMQHDLPTGWKITYPLGGRKAAAAESAKTAMSKKSDTSPPSEETTPAAKPTAIPNGEKAIVLPAPSTRWSLPGKSRKRDTNSGSTQKVRDNARMPNGK